MEGMMDLSKLISEEDVKLEAEIEKELEVAQKSEPSVVENVVKENVVTDAKVEKVAEPVVAEKVETGVKSEESVVKDVKEEKAKKDDFVDTIGIQMPSEDKYLKNLKSYTWIEDPVDGEVKIYRIDKDKTYEKRTKYRYLAPQMVEEVIGTDVLSFTELGGSFVYTIIADNNIIFTINDTITGYYPAVATIVNPVTKEAIDIKIKHTARFITDLVGEIGAMCDNNIPANQINLKERFARFITED